MFNGDDMPYKDSYGDDEVNPANSVGMSISMLRDKALIIFDSFVERMAAAKKDAPILPTPNILALNMPEEELEARRRFLSVEETETILAEHNQKAGLPEGIYAIGGKTPEEAAHNFIAMLHALGVRIMSNITNYATNNGLLDCCFDDDDEAFSFRVTDLGKKVTKAAHKLEKKNKNKSKKRNSSEGGVNYDF